MTAVKPMLACKAGDLEALPYPLLASRKLDGIRCLITPDGPQTRSGEPIPNLHVRKLLSLLPVGLDGELVCRDAAGKVDFRLTTGNVRREEGVPDFEYQVFDWYTVAGPFEARQAWLIDYFGQLRAPAWCRRLQQYWVKDAAGVRNFFEAFLAEGDEGVILRDPLADYKHGRATLKSAGMLKVKPYEDAEGVILSVFERMHNTNEATKDALGHTKRANTKDAKEGTGMLGGFVVRMRIPGRAGHGPDDFAEFEVSAGKTTHEEKRDLWARREELIGRVIRFQYVTVGGYDVPRHATFQGFREAWDMDAPDALP